MKAVILAAGCATRLRPHTDDTPKCLLPVAGVPILRRAITTLMRCGIDSFVIGTGYLEHMVRDSVARWFPDLDVTFVTNANFRSTNNAYSLLLLRSHLDGESFIMLDGDVVFDIGVIQTLLTHGPDCLALRSAGEIGLEEVKVAADQSDRVLAIGKHVPVASAVGESVGIELFSASSSTRLFASLHHRMHELGYVNEYYEAAFQEIVEDGVALRAVDIGAMYATEIDTIEDLVAANQRMAARPAFDTRIPARLAAS